MTLTPPSRAGRSGELSCGDRVKNGAGDFSWQQAGMEADGATGAVKHQTPESMKFRKLQRRLGCSRVVLVGTLELLWIAVQKNCPRGDIGRHTNEEIAIECEWEGDPEELVSALVDTGWLDECETHRLVVHDWEEHCPGWVKRQLSRHNKSIVTVSSSQTVTNDRLDATPNLTQPNLTIIRRALGGEDANGTVAYADICGGARKLFSDLKVRPATKDARLVLVCLGLRQLGRFHADDIRKAVQTTREDRPDKPMAYLKTILSRIAKDRGFVLNKAITDATIPEDLLQLPAPEKDGCHAVPL